MATFDAGSAVESLGYDFTAYVPGCKGKIPEPTDKQLKEFGRRAAAVFKEQGAKGKRGENPNTLLAQLSPEKLGPATVQTVEIVADFCQGRPSQDDLRALPFFVRQAFVQWLFEELFDPKGRGSDSSP